MSRPSNDDCACGDVHETGGAAGEGGLPATRFADQAQGLASGQLQGNTVDGVDQTMAVRRVGAAEPFHQRVEPQDWVAGPRWPALSGHGGAALDGYGHSWPLWRVGQPARGPLQALGIDLDEGWFLELAAFEGDGAAGVEATARREGDEAGGLSGYLGQPGPAPRARRQRRQQPPGVRMSGRVIEAPPFGVLDHLAGVHDRNLISQPGHYAKVVSDHDHGHAQFCLELLDELDDLRLHRDIEGRSGLVRDQELGPERQGHGDHGPLAHAS